MIVSTGPNHAKILEFKFTAEEEKARDIITLQTKTNEPIENFVIDAAHGYAKYCLSNITKLIKKRIESGIDSGEYKLVFDRWRYHFVIYPPKYEPIYFRIANENEYSFLFHFLKFSYFSQTFYSEFFKQLDEYLGPHSYDETTFFWPFLKFII